MKLKKAARLANLLGYHWVAVDMNGAIFAYTEMPTLNEGMYEHMWEVSLGSFKRVGSYTGSKTWTTTRRVV